MFPVADYVGPDLATYAHAEPQACKEHELAPQILARAAHSCHRISPEEYGELATRMAQSNMAEFVPTPADFIIGLFGRWNQARISQRLLVDARPPNC